MNWRRRTFTTVGSRTIAGSFPRSTPRRSRRCVHPVSAGSRWNFATAKMRRAFSPSPPHALLPMPPPGATSRMADLATGDAVTCGRRADAGLAPRPQRLLCVFRSRSRRCPVRPNRGGATEERRSAPPPPLFSGSASPPPTPPPLKAAHRIAARSTLRRQRSAVVGSSRKRSIGILRPNAATRILHDGDRNISQRVVNNVPVTHNVMRRPRRPFAAEQTNRREWPVENSGCDLPHVAQARDPRLLSFGEQKLRQPAGVRYAIGGIAMLECDGNLVQVVDRAHRRILVSSRRAAERDPPPDRRLHPLHRDRRQRRRDDARNPRPRNGHRARHSADRRDDARPANWRISSTKPRTSR